MKQRVYGAEVALSNRLSELYPEAKEEYLKELSNRLADSVMLELVFGGEKIIRQGEIVPREDEFKGATIYQQKLYVEDLVRCKDCIHWRKPGSPCPFGILTFNASPPYGFCHLGERQEDGKTD